MESSNFKRFSMALLLSLLMVFPLVLGKNTADVGVKAGDWVKYKVTKQGRPAVWGTLPVEKAVGAKVEVLNVSGTVIWIGVTYHLPDGSQEKETQTRDLQDTTGYVLPANVSAGDKIAEWGPLHEEKPILINATVWRSYSETTRIVNVLKTSYITSILDHLLNITLELCWDKQTGLLLEKTLQMYPLDVENASLFIWTWEISDTNLWKMETSQQTSQPLLWAVVGLTVTTGVGAVITLKSLKNRGNKTKVYEK